MRVEMVNDEDIDIYINPYNFRYISVYSKENILEFIKEYLLIINTRYRLNLSGFYKIKSYFNKKAGLFLNVIKIDENEFSNDIDFRIILFQNERFLFEVEDYDVIKDIPNKILYNNKFYTNVDDIYNIDKVIDMGRIVYGDEVKEILSNSRKFSS